LRATRVDAPDSRMSVRTAQECQVQHAGQYQVCHVRAATRDESRILLPQESPADQALAHERIMAESRPPSR
jgi:hypothetical protein